MAERLDDKCASECGFVGDCPEGMECPLPKEPEQVPEEEIVALFRTYHGHEGAVLSLAVSDGKTGLSGSADTTMRLWDLATGECLKTLAGHTAHVRAVALTPDGKYAISGGSDKTLKVWDLKPGRCLQTIEAHDDTINAVAVSPDGRFVLSGGRDKAIKRWEFL